MKPLGDPGRNSNVNTVYSLALGFSPATPHRTNNNGIPAGKVCCGLPSQGTVLRGCMVPASPPSHTLASPGLPPTSPFLNL